MLIRLNLHFCLSFITCIVIVFSFFHSHSHTLSVSAAASADDIKVEDMRNMSCSDNVGNISSLRRALRFMDADFFTDAKIHEAVESALRYNIPTIKVNRRGVASVDGGLRNPPALLFNPLWDHDNTDHHTTSININGGFHYPPPTGINRPKFDEDIAFLTVLELGELIRSRQITSTELTRIFLRRLRRYSHDLRAVITYTEELAYRQAKEADQLLIRGVYLGPLHGIPYGLQDIIAVPHYRTTWGSATYKDQVINVEAWVYKRLKLAGGVLVAKLATGSLGWGDIWFGGRTRNPWNIKDFSTGSSSGPAASTSAGLVPFAIGSETAGSISYPAARCGVTALRPTFGSVGRSGVMSISESLDKLGPFCRNAADCVVILDAIRGRDPQDPSSRDIAMDNPFTVDITKLTVGYDAADQSSREVVEVLSSKGVNMVPNFKLKYTVESVKGILYFTMDVDMLSHFDKWQRSNKDDASEAPNQWPRTLRQARLLPAVDYVQAQRARRRLIEEVRESFTVDAFIGNATDWEKVCMGNLVGMPLIVVPTGFNNITNPPLKGTKRRSALTTGIYAPPQKDHIALALAMAYQSVTDHHKQRPPITNLGPEDPIDP